jgi:hypothetical protein
MFNAALLKGLPIEVCKSVQPSDSTCIPYVYASPTIILPAERQILVFKDVGTCL